MNIETKIREIAEKYVPDMTLVMGSLLEIDTKIDLHMPPFCVVVFPEMGTLRYHRGRFKEGIRMLIGFFDVADRDASAEDNFEVYRRMMEKAKDFIRGYNADGYFEPIEGTVEIRLYTEMMASNLTGLFLDVEVRELTGNC